MRFAQVGLSLALICIGLVGLYLSDRQEPTATTRTTIEVKESKARVTIDPQENGRKRLSLWINGPEWKLQENKALGSRWTGEGWEFVATVDVSAEQADSVAAALTTRKEP